MNQIFADRMSPADGAVLRGKGLIKQVLEPPPAAEPIGIIKLALRRSKMIAGRVVVPQKKFPLTSRQPQLRVFLQLLEKTKLHRLSSFGP